jgi:chorismate mutase
MEQIDYAKLNERVVEQAYESVYKTELSPEDFQKLIQDKFERAKLYQKAVLKSPTFSVN